MFTKQQNPRINYISRLLCLPLIIIVIAAFTLKPNYPDEQYQLLQNNKAKTDKALSDTLPLASNGKELMNVTALHNQRTPDTQPVFQKPEIDPIFPGGREEWRKFLQKNLNAATPVDSGAPAGQYTVMTQFIVDKDGNLSDIKTLTTHGYGMEQEVLRMMKLSPKWIPAKQNGKVVAAYMKQPVTFVITNGDDDANTTTSENKLKPSGFEISADELKKLSVKQLTQRNTNHDVISFSFVTEKGHTYFEVVNNGIQINDQTKSYIESLKSGDIVLIESITANVNGKVEKLPSIYWVIK
jgi:hypothetical protein